MNWEVMSAIGQLAAVPNWHSLSDLSGCPNQRPNEGTAPLSGECADRTVGRYDKCAARQRGAQRHLPTRRPIFQRSRVERTMSDLVACPGMQQWWQVRRHWHTEGFGRMVDAIIAKPPSQRRFQSTASVETSRSCELADRQASALR